jgi:Domain of unknown function (DUF5655)
LRQVRPHESIDAVKPLWTCPRCGRRFVTANLWHSCEIHTLEEHFQRTEPHVIETYRAYEAAVRAIGPVEVVPQKSRVVFMVRMRFAGCTFAKRWLNARFLLTRRIDSPRIVKVEQFGPRSFGHHLRLSSPEDVDDELKAWLVEAYAVGEQRHLRSDR